MAAALGVAVPMALAFLPVSVGESPASGEGHTVAFHSFATNLTPNDTNAVADVFVRGPDQ